MYRMTKTSNAQRVERYREKLRSQGMRPIQIWVPDTRRRGFAEEAQRQGRLVSASYSEDPDLAWWLDSAETEFDAFYRGKP